MVTELDRIFIRVLVTMPEHPKISAVSDRSFRTLVRLICWARLHETDGQVPSSVVAQYAATNTIKQLIDHRLLDRIGGQYVIHDYLDYQQSAAEIEAARIKLSEQRAEAGRRGQHSRWHLARNIVDPSCPYCQP